MKPSIFTCDCEALYRARITCFKLVGMRERQGYLGAIKMSVLKDRT